MAKRKKKKRIWPRRIAWFFGLPIGLCLYLVLMFAAFNPKLGFYASSEVRRLGEIKQQWVNFEEISISLKAAVVAAEDANFCNHPGFDFKAIESALLSGTGNGASTITQQVAKNVYLWHGRNFIRKGLEAGFTIFIELFWSKQRILEVYLNVVEFDEGVFGAQAASRHHFGVDADAISLRQSALLAAVLPNPKGRSAINPSAQIASRAAEIRSGAQTILADGRAECLLGG